MKRNIYRSIAIYAVLIFTFIYIYPTIGWMLLSEQERSDRLAAWKAEDSVYTPPNVFKDMAKAVKRWAQFDRSKVVTLGLDLQGGIHMVVGFELTQEQKDQGMTDEEIQEKILRRITRRIDEFEAKEPIIQKMGTNQIQIQLPGEKDVDRARELIKKTAKLDFHIVRGSDETVATLRKIEKDNRFLNRFTPFLHAPAYPGGPFRFPKEHVEKISAVVDELNATTGLLPEGTKFALSQPPNPWDDEQNYELYLMDSQVMISGEGLERAMAAPDDQRPPYYQILFSFKGAAANEFGRVTEKYVGHPMAIVVDGKVVSAPTIQSKIMGNGQITGKFSGPQAQDLAIALSSGSMPVPLREEYTGVVGASLGSDSIRQGVYASVTGLIAVLIFMGVYYRLGGLIANIALFLNGFVLLALFAYFHLTLTLPGIAGFVLTLGMAVDANVLIFERIREEVRNGKSLHAAIALGYDRATVTILDSNITTLIAALVLLQFGTGPVQGFGVALSLGIFTSVFTALVVTHAVFEFLMRHKMLHKLTMMSMVKETKIPFVEFKNKAFIISGAIILICLAVFFARGPRNNLGVDFAGGTTMVVKLETDKTVQVGEVRELLAKAGFRNSVVQEYGEGGTLDKNKFAVRTSEIEEKAAEGTEDSTESEIKTRVTQALAPLCGSAAATDKVDIEQMEMVGSAIGGQLRLDALKAVAFSLIFMIAYMWFRYSLIFGVTAVVAVFHDALIAVGFLALTGRHIDMNVIAALLTIIGYSVNDTVVIYDRIRENLRLYAGRGLSLGQIMNLAINQTLGRTILTSTVTMLTVVMLFVFGGKVLNDFAFCLIIGIISGTYSTVFIATSLALIWQNWWRGRLHAAASRGNTPRKRREAAAQ